MEIKYYYGQKIYYASNFEEIKTLVVREIVDLGSEGICLGQKEGNSLMINISKDNEELCLVSYDPYHRRYKKEYDKYAVSLNKDTLAKELAQKVINNEKAKIKKCNEQIKESWEIISKANSYI